MISLTDEIDSYYATLILLLIFGFNHYFWGPARPHVMLYLDNYTNGKSVLSLAYQRAEVKAWAIGYWNLVVRHAVGLIVGFALSWLAAVVMGA
ncbi:hypothetical protein LTR27_000781 [Elasticomyces elasticus]|nr:hypothetical protein LTR27_000781 [Elasticomyces elasticus]